MNIILSTIVSLFGIHLLCDRNVSPLELNFVRIHLGYCAVADNSARDLSI